MIFWPWWLRCTSRPRSLLDRYAALPPGPCGARIWSDGTRCYLPTLPQIERIRWNVMTEHTGDDPLPLDALLSELEASQ